MARAWQVALGILALAIAIRAWGLASTPLWTDELFTRFYPDLGLRYLWGAGMRAEPTPPLYYSLIAGIEALFGPSALALRLPSVLASAASVAVAWLLARELFDGLAPAIVAALLVAVAPVEVQFAQEARSYALQGAALALALLGLARFLRGAPGLLPYASGAILALWLHPTSVIAVAAINAGVLAASLGRAPLVDRRRLGRWSLATLLVAATCLPLVPGWLWPPDGGAGTSWIPHLSRVQLENVIGETLAGPALVPHAQAIAEAAAFALLLLFLVPPWRPGRRAAIVLLLVPGLALAAMIGVSVARPILLSRTLAWLLVPLAAALGAVLSRRPAIAAAVFALAATALALQLRAGPTLKEDWPGLFAQMGDLAPPAALVLAPHTPPSAVAVYASAGTRPLRLDDGIAMSETTVMGRVFPTPTIDAAGLVARIAAGPVWLVYRRPEYEWVQRLIASLPPPTRTVASEPGRNPALRALYWQPPSNAK